jgi:hypothetical protein
MSEEFNIKDIKEIKEVDPKEALIGITIKYEKQIKESD